MAVTTITSGSPVNAASGLQSLVHVTLGTSTQVSSTVIPQIAANTDVNDPIWLTGSIVGIDNTLSVSGLSNVQAFSTIDLGSTNSRSNLHHAYTSSQQTVLASTYDHVDTYGYAMTQDGQIYDNINSIIVRTPRFESGLIHYMSGLPIYITGILFPTGIDGTGIYGTGILTNSGYLYSYTNTLGSIIPGQYDLAVTEVGENVEPPTSMTVGIATVTYRTAREYNSNVNITSESEYFPAP